ncbi:hypothetical protein M408DRAFT_332716 [Serendipita vermifera MAFF 305830]|uniref:DOPA 4,5-dioxygenase n=1 Tax=Serendipita vermifera MAFF 305830 TaxID=933852 RepID=A0A0C3AU96_SERVB|nr:hypothetical protein M408DRAFT_332716 [Serendipita vermifera MAFF 305830]
MYTSPLAIYQGQNLTELPSGVNADGKSLDNGLRERAGGKSAAYVVHPLPIKPPEQGNAFDFHIYYLPNNASERQYAKELHERIRREFPELRIYKFWDRAVGPHPVPMFEVNTFTPVETGALFGFLTVWRGPLSVLVHPNTDNELRDHTELCTWMGRPWPIDTSVLSHKPQ